MEGRAARASGPADGRIWDGVDRLLDRALHLADLRSHQLQLLAARRWRALGLPVPAELVDEERFAAVVVLTAPILLERARGAYDGTMLLMKGPEVAARYPDPALRPFKDLDLLVEDAEAAQRALLAAGFEAVGDPALYEGIHHVRPLAFPGLPLTIELHSSPKWIERLAPPAPAELFAVATDGRAAVDGVLALPAAHHALVLAAHSWGHEPLRRLRDLVDVAALAQGLDRDELRGLAAAWKMERAWTTTIGAADALFLGGSPPWAVRVWARNLEKMRERTVLENHLERWLSDFWALPARDAVRALGSTFAGEIRPAPGESWGAKLARSARAVRNASLRRSEHDLEWQQEAERLRERS
ncbi:MAG: nucleotidyltransferase family protein [Gaiellaceae bacterium]